MNLYEELRILENDALVNLSPECADRLICIGWIIVDVYRPNPMFIHNLQTYEDYFERWGTCYDRFWSMHRECMSICTPSLIDLETDSDH